MHETELDVLSLKRGYDLNGFIITDTLGSGSFAKVYLAKWPMMGISVAIKEYLPIASATRTQGLTVVPNSQKRAAEFEKGLERFIEEGRTLARLHERYSLPNVVHVLQIIEANGTAYLVTKYYGRKSLQDFLDGGEQLNARHAQAMFEKLLAALDVVHQSGIIHRDISPDNILLNDGEPVLIDFGGARDFINRTSNLSSALGKRGYMPIEQYGQEQQASLPVGPWSDLYSLAATFYHLITGTKPVEALYRGYADMLVNLMEKRPQGYPMSFLLGLDWCLRFKPEQRPQSVEKLREVLKGTEKLPKLDAPVKTATTGVGADTQSFKRWGVWAGVALLIVGATLSVAFWGGSNLNRTISLLPVKNTLTLNLSPKDDVSVVIDGGKASYSPGMELAAGEHHLAISAPEYEAIEKTVMISRGQNVIDLALTKISTGQLYLDLQPADMAIEFTGGIKHYQPGMSVPIDKEIFYAARKEGFVDSSGSFRLVPGKNTKEIRLALQPKGRLTISVANLRWGKVTLLEPKIEYKKKMEIPIGTVVKYSVSADCYATKTGSFVMKKDEENIQIRLQEKFIGELEHSDDLRYAYAQNFGYRAGSFAYSIFDLLTKSLNPIGSAYAYNSLLSQRVVYFDYGSYRIRSDSYEALQAHAEYLSATRSAIIRIEGHTDERASRECHRVLGERRAQAVRDFLIANGAYGYQFDIVSYGEEKPVADGHEEGSWAQNRRAELVYTAEAP